MSRSHLVVALGILLSSTALWACDVGDEPLHAGPRSVVGPANDSQPSCDGDAGDASAPPDGGVAADEVVTGAFAAPNGTPNAPCTKDAPCDWKTAMRSKESTVVLMDGTYVVPARVVWCVRDGKTVRAHHRWAAKVAFEGNADASGDEDGACNDASGFGFALHGALIGLEIVAPARWSAIDSFEATPGVRSRIENVLVHDVNTATQEYSSAYGNCVQQGALDLIDTDLVDSVVYRTGQRVGNDTLRGSTNLTTCINYHAVYVTHQSTVSNDLIVDNYGGWCVHGYKPTDVFDVVEKNTLIGCHQGGVILPIFPENRVSDNVIVRGRPDTAGPQYGACITSYWGGATDPERLVNDVCRDNPHDAVYDSASGTFTSRLLDDTADVTPVLRAPADVDAAFDAAVTPGDKRAVARSLSVDRTKTRGAGFVLP